MPIRRRFANRSTVLSVSAQARATIAPTVRHAIRISSHTAVFEHATANHATVSSKPKVCPGGVPRPPDPHARWDRARGSSPAARRPPAAPRTLPQSSPRQRRRHHHPGGRTAPSAHIGRSGPAHPAAAAHAR